MQNSPRPRSRSSFVASVLKAAPKASSLATHIMAASLLVLAGITAAALGAPPALAATTAAPSSPAKAEKAPSAPTEKEPPASEGGGILSLLPAASVTKHTITLNGHTLNYQATAGALPIRAANGKILARMFYVAYTKLPASHARPLTFVFNGGPGAASAYLNLGAMGPKVVVMNKDGSLPPPPSKLEANPDSWLAFTDLVFVDPVGTGYSRAVNAKANKDFWGVKQDTRAMAAFIRLYLALKERASSPIFLAGESYGGLRAAKLAYSLPSKSGIGVSGLVLISPALEFSDLFANGPGVIMPDVLGLPSMAAVNFYDHGATTRQALAEKLKSVTHYALNGYLTALAAGPAVSQKVATPEVTKLLGLPEAYVRKNYGDVSLSQFAKNYHPGRQLSRYDGTVSGPDTEPASPFLSGPDPVLDRTIPVFTSTFTDYVRHDLGYKTDVSYRLLNRKISEKWNYGLKPTDQGYVGAMNDLQKARALNPSLQVLIASGYTDMVTPFFGVRYLVNQMPPLAGAVPIEMKDYLGGHMMYLRPASRDALMEDAAAMYKRALATKKTP